MDYERLNIFYRQGIIKAAGFLLAKTLEQGPMAGWRRHSRDQLMQSIAGEHNGMLPSSPPPPPRGDLPSRELHEYSACVRLYGIAEKMRIVHLTREPSGSRSSGTALEVHLGGASQRSKAPLEVMVSGYCRWDFFQPTLVDLWKASAEAVEEAEGILPNPLERRDLPVHHRG